MSAIGKRVVLTDCDGSRLLNEQMPISGIVERDIRSVGANLWSLLLLDRPFAYQVHDSATKQYKGFEVKRLLIRSRWENQSIGDIEPTSVFVLVAEDEQAFAAELVDPKQFHFEAWAMCQNEKGANHVP